MVGQPHHGRSDVIKMSVSLNIHRKSEAFSYENLPHCTGKEQRQSPVVVHVCFTIYVVLPG